MGRGYIELIEGPKCLTLKLTPEGREELESYKDTQPRPDIGWTKGTDAILCDMLEDHLCNGWEMVPPEDIGALTSAPILSNEAERDDDGKLIKIGKVYWFPNYMVECELETMLEKGEVVFPLGE